MSPAPDASSATAAPAGASAMSGHIDTRTAAIETAELLHEQIGDTCDLALVFGSFHHRAGFATAVRTIRDTIGPQVILGVTAESVVHDGLEHEGVSGLSAVAMRLPGTTMRTWTHGNDLGQAPPEDVDAIGELLGCETDTKATIIVADPFSTQVPQLLPTIDEAARRAGSTMPVLGGLASGGSQPGQNVLVVNDQVGHLGAMGVTISGSVTMDTVVSQGCRGIGEPLVITKVHQNIILELGGERALDVLQDMGRTLDDDERTLLGGGLFCGLVVDEYKERFGRGDFLVRNVLRLDQRVGGIAIGDLPRVGQTMQFHARDANTAREDLQLLLDAQQLQDPPYGAVLFTCNGRGTRLFSEPHQDAGALHERLNNVPLAGLFAGGEIGPIGDRSFLHGHTACAGVFRRARRR